MTDCTIDVELLRFFQPGQQAKNNVGCAKRQADVGHPCFTDENRKLAIQARHDVRNGLATTVEVYSKIERALVGLVEAQIRHHCRQVDAYDTEIGIEAGFGVPHQEKMAIELRIPPHEFYGIDRQ